MAKVKPSIAVTATLFSVLSFGVLLFALSCAATLVAIGGGALLNRFFPFSLFSGSILFLATIAVSVMALGFAFVNDNLSKRNIMLATRDEDWGWDDEDADDEEEIDGPSRTRRSIELALNQSPRALGYPW
jgi:hypothetical protein